MKQYKKTQMRFLKNIKPAFSFLMLLFLIVSCKDEAPKEAKEFDKKMDETIQIHDEVMPKMSEITSLIKQLEKKKDSLATSKNVDETKEKLQKGHDKMMTWMKDLSDSFTAQQINQGIQIKDQDSLQKALKKLEELRSEADDMQKLINSSIEDAEQILSSGDN